MKAACAGGALALAALGLTLAGCGDRRVVVEDLAASAAAAEVLSSWLVIRFGAPAAAMFEEQGLSAGAGDSGDAWAEARRRCSVFVRWPAVAPRFD